MFKKVTHTTHSQSERMVCTRGPRDSFISGSHLEGCDRLSNIPLHTSSRYLWNRFDSLCNGFAYVFHLPCHSHLQYNTTTWFFVTFLRTNISLLLWWKFLNAISTHLLDNQVTQVRGVILCGAVFHMTFFVDKCYLKFVIDPKKIRCRLSSFRVLTFLSQKNMAITSMVVSTQYSLIGRNFEFHDASKGGDFLLLSLLLW